MNRRELMLRAIVGMTGVMAGTPALRVLAGESPSAQASRALFTEGQSRTIAVLAEMIIPQTDTPGAVTCGVPAFIEMMVADWYTDTERRIFLAGLRDLDMECLLNHRENFAQCDETQRAAALAESEKAASTYVSPFAGGPIGLAMSKLVDEHTPFFTKLKELTVIGFFSSEIGATQVLAYNPMPMRYDGDYDYAKTGRQWSY